MNYIQEEVMENTVLGLDARLRKQEFIEEHEEEWLERGLELKNKRIALDISITQLSKMLGTSTSRLRKFEAGEPIMMADHLISTYKLALELTKLKMEQKLAAINL